jgi:universal stress protein E
MSKPILTIVAGVARPSADDPTLVAAVQLARWTGAKLHVVHTFDFPPVFTGVEPGYDAGQWAAYLADDGREQLEAELRELAPDVAIVCTVTPGPPASAILDAAQESGAELLVVGAGSAGRIAGAFLGTTAQRVLRGAGAPVLVVRRAVRHPLERVLIATDLSELAAAVHTRGAETVEAVFGTPAAVQALHVAPIPHVGHPVPSEAVEAGTREALKRFLATLPPAPHPVTPVVRFGGAADRIVTEAESWNADVLVVGTQARGWAERLLLGSVAEAALRDAPCNVLAIPPAAVGAEEEEEEEG